MSLWLPELAALAGTGGRAGLAVRRGAHLHRARVRL